MEAYLNALLLLMATGGAILAVSLCLSLSYLLYRVLTDK
jgi:hypothetical protein